MNRLPVISFIIIVFILSFLACFALTEQPADNEDYSWPMFAGNLQRNGRANQPALKGPNMTWAFFSPNSADFEGFPMYDYINELIWVTSSDGFLYKINATNGTMLSEICVGKAPEFEGDPCGGVFFDNDDIFGKISMLSTRDIVFTYNTIENNAEGPNVMVAVSHTDDSILWKYETYKSPVDPTGNFVFTSIPTVIPLALNNLSDAIIVWINNPNSTGNISGYSEYTIIDSLKGAPVLTRLYPTPNNQEFPAMAVDPSDGNVISMYVNDLQPECGADYEQFFLCTGIGKFHTLTGESIWNSSIQESYAHGIALSSGNIYISTTQLDAYSFTTSGKGRWKNPESTSTYDMFLPSVCSDETVIFTDNAQFIQGWGIKMTRPMKPLFWEGTNGPVSKIATTTNDQVFYTNEGNSIYAHSCVNGTVLWSRDFGDSDSYFDPVTIGYKALYANVYKSGTGGAVIKLEDLGGLGDSQGEKHAYMW